MSIEITVLQKTGTLQFPIEKRKDTFLMTMVLLKNDRTVENDINLAKISRNKLTVVFQRKKPI